MRQIRKHLFETNSSSTHTIVIANDSDDEFKNNLPQKIVFDVGEFGWEFKRYDDKQTRADYLFTAIICNNMCDKYLPIIKQTLEKWDVEAIFPDISKKKCTYSNIEYDVLADDENRWYCIDHCDELREFIEMVCNDEVLLMNYLFSEKSLIATGNDNDDGLLNDKCDANNVLLEFDKGN